MAISDRLADRVHTFMKERNLEYEAAHPGARKGYRIKPHEVEIVSTMGKLTLIITAFLKAAERQSDEEKKKLCQFLYEGRQVIKDIAPETVTPGEHCPICKVDEVPKGETCPHGTLVAAAILLMAQLRFEPRFDMGDDEIPPLDGEDGSIPEVK